MTVTFAERTAARREAARQVHDIEVSGRPEPQRLSEICEVLTGLARRPELFPVSAFPRAPGTSGGLFRLAHSPDGRGGIYVSLGFTGRGGGKPHTHVSWAAVVGVSGGVETNRIWDPIGEDQFELKEEVVVGPGDAILLPTGAYHTIEVISDTPVLHVHAYGHAAERPGFQPPLPAVTWDEARTEGAAGRLAVVALDGQVSGLEGPYVRAAAAHGLPAALADVPLDLPVALLGEGPVADEAGAGLYRDGRVVVFRLDPQDAA